MKAVGYKHFDPNGSLGRNSMRCVGYKHFDPNGSLGRSSMTR